MRWINGWLTATICVLGFVGTMAQAASDHAAVRQVRSAVQELDRWLGDDENARQWRSFLQFDELQAQLEKGDAADRHVVQRIHSIYAGDAPGLQSRRFAAVRRALPAWLDQLPPWNREHLPQAIRDAKQDYVAITDDRVQQVRSRLRSSLQKLAEFLRRGGEEKSAQWKEYLRWNDLEKQLAEDQKPNRRTLSEISDKFRQNEEGLERPEFTEVRAGIDDYGDAVLFATNPKSKEFFETNLEELAQSLETNAGELSTDDARKIGTNLGWLDRFRQRRDVADAVRQQLSRPNLFLQFSEKMLGSGVNQAVDRTVGIREHIMGTSIRGTARMQGQISLDLRPAANPAAFDVVLTGTTFSSNTGRNGPVTIHSSGVTSVSGRKQLLLDEEGVAGKAARAACSTRSKIHSISARCNLIRKAAWKRAGKSKSKVEAIASQRAARRVEHDMNVQAAEMLATLNDTFENQFRKPLLRRNGFPERLEFESTDDSLLVTMLQAGRDLLAAPTDPPALTSGHDIAVRFHESLVGNFSQAAFGGVTLKDTQAAQLVEDLTGSVPPELVITQESDPWSIRFASETPIQVRVDDQQFTLSIRGTQFTRGDEAEINETMVISATYTVAKTPEGALLTRQGDIQVAYPALKTEGVDEIAMKSFVKAKFAGLMKPEIAGVGMVLPGRWETLGTLQLQQLHCDDGWAAVGWQTVPQQEQVALSD